jgi:hypothetical protein
MSLKSCVKGFFLVAFVVAIARAEKPPVADARQLLAYIDRKGAQTTLHELSSQEVERVLTRIDSGAPLWLEVAKKLAPVSDGAAAEGLGISLAIALTLNPEGVLPLLGAPNELPLGIDRVCSLPFIESTERHDREHVRRVRAALRHVTSPDLTAKKAECLKIINDLAATRLVPPM